MAILMGWIYEGICMLGFHIVAVGCINRVAALTLSLLPFSTDPIPRSVDFFNRIFCHVVMFIIRQYLSFCSRNRFQIFRTLTSHNSTLEKEILMQNSCNLAFTAPSFASRSLLPKREHCNHCFAIAESPCRNLFIEITRIHTRAVIFWA